MNDASIAIVSWNTRELLDQCLQSVYDNSSGFEFETIVVDNASDDESADMVSMKYPDVNLVRSRVNLGFAAGCNIGFKKSNGRYFILLNPDTIVLENALGRLVKFMDAHPDAGAAGCRLLNKDGSLQRSCSCYPSLLTELFDALYLSKIFPKSKLFAQYSMSYWDFSETREVDFAGGGCLIVRSEAIEEVGLLDEGYFMYTEEADWCYRLKQDGWKIFYYPSAKIIHLGGQSSTKYGNDILIHLYSSRNKFMKKHNGVFTAAIHRSIVAMSALIRLPIFWVMKFFRKSDPDAAGFQVKLLRWALTGTKCEGNRS